MQESPDQIWHPTSAETHTCGGGGAGFMLSVRGSKTFTPEVNLREYISCTSLPSVTKVAHSGFETWRRHHQKSKTGVSVTPQKKDSCPPKVF